MLTQNDRYLVPSSSSLDIFFVYYGQLSLKRVTCSSSPSTFLTPPRRLYKTRRLSATAGCEAGRTQKRPRTKNVPYRRLLRRSRRFLVFSLVILLRPLAIIISLIRMRGNQTGTETVAWRRYHRKIKWHR